MTFLDNICDEVEKFCDVAFSSSELYVETRSSTVKRDNGDLKKLMDWLSNHPPFPKLGVMMSISTEIMEIKKYYISQKMSSEDISKYRNRR
ncbi:hypothetical protein WA026_017387, partial [Henosepilachna vigintioctopunctata]